MNSVEMAFYIMSVVHGLILLALMFILIQLFRNKI